MKMFSLLLSLMILFSAIILASSLVLFPIIFRRRLVIWCKNLFKSSFSCHQYSYLELDKKKNNVIQSSSNRVKSRMLYRSVKFPISRLLRKYNCSKLYDSIVLHYNLYNKKTCPSVSIISRE